MSEDQTQHPALTLILALLGVALIGAFGANLAHAADAVPAPSGTLLSPDSPEKVSVDAIKEKYWARGDESELGVVQNRLYSKEHKIEFGLFGGFITTDPFLSVNNLGFNLGFNFSEYFAVHALAWHDFVSPSTAEETFEQKLGAVTNYNAPRNFWGLEATGSILYGKLSLIGKKIIYYDMHLSGGIGLTSTESGNNGTVFGGIGQRVYLSQAISLRVDYRLMRFTETIVEKTITNKLGQSLGDRTNWTNAITVGLDFFLGVAQ